MTANTLACPKPPSTWSAGSTRRRPRQRSWSKRRNYILPLLFRGGGWGVVASVASAALTTPLRLGSTLLSLAAPPLKRRGFEEYDNGTALRTRYPGPPRPQRGRLHGGRPRHRG